MPLDASNPYAHLVPQATPTTGGDVNPYMSLVPKKPDQTGDEYTGTFLPFRRDKEGLHLAVPEVIAAPARGVVEMGKRALGVGEGGQSPLRPLAPDSTAAVLGLAGSPIMGAERAAVEPALSRGLSRGQQMLKDYEAAGVTPNAPTVGQGRSAGLATQITSYLPATGEAVRGAIERTTGDTAAATERAAAGFGPQMPTEQTGSLLQRGIDRFAKSVFPERAEELYGNFDRLMVGAPPVPVTNTLSALEGPMKRFPTSPELGAQLTNPQLRAYAGTLTPKEKEIPPVFSSIVNEFGQPVLLKASEKLKSGGSLTFDELKELRSSIGRKLGDPVLVSDIPRADLKNVYAGISRDLEAAAKKQSPAALQAFKRASAYYKAGLDRIDKLEPLLSGSPERTVARINAAAGEGASADVGLLRTIKKSVAPQEWRQVGASVIRRLGEPTKGAKDILAPADFSPASFATNWNKLSPSAKDVLFGADLPDTPRAGLETLSRVVQSQKNLGRLANVSKSAEHGITFALAWEAMRTLAYQPMEAAGIAAGAAGAYGMAKILMSPGFAKWLYRLPQETAAETPALAVRRAQTSLLGLLAADHPDTAEPRKAAPTSVAPTVGIAPNSPIPAAAPGWI